MELREETTKAYQIHNFLLSLSSAIFLMEDFAGFGNDENRENTENPDGKWRGGGFTRTKPALN